MSTEPTEHARFAADYLLDQFKIIDQVPIRITIDSQIPAGFHLGSSAAVAVGLSGAMMYFLKNFGIRCG